MGGHALFETGIRRLGTKENGFFYRYARTGETVREGRVLARIENLKVPPAWEGARIARSPMAKVQAVGYDSASRVQYVYSARYRERKEREKFERVLRFADALPLMRETTSEHLGGVYLGPDKVLAAMTRLMNAAYFRVGDERYAKENKTYGIATLRRKHLRIEGDTMTFEYSGKWGKTHRKIVTDRSLREVVEECVGLPGYEVFKYLDEGGGVRDVKARDLNLYVKQVMGGDPDRGRQARGARTHHRAEVRGQERARSGRCGSRAAREHQGYSPRLVYQPEGHRPLPGRFRGSLPR